VCRFKPTAQIESDAIDEKAIDLFEVAVGTEVDGKILLGT
jgi:hypothetical protein